jgi:hypothetical protein
MNGKDLQGVATAVAIIGGLYLAYRVVKGVGAGASAVGDAVGGAVDAVKDGANAVGGWIGDAWGWGLGTLGLGLPTESVYTSQEVAKIGAKADYSKPDPLWYLQAGTGGGLSDSGPSFSDLSK